MVGRASPGMMIEAWIVAGIHKSYSTAHVTNECMTCMKLETESVDVH